jgi:hypothetical protein
MLTESQKAMMIRFAKRDYPDGEMYECPAQMAKDMATLAADFAKDHPIEHQEVPDSSWYEANGFTFDDNVSMSRKVGPFELVATGDIYTLEKDTHLAIYAKYQNGTQSKISMYHGLYDNPTIEQVLNLIRALEGK